MRKLLAILPLLMLLTGCSIFSELTAFKKCEFRLYSIQDPALCGIDLTNRNSWSDFSMMEGQTIALHLLRKDLPFDVTVNMEVNNPGPKTAAMNSIEWMAYIDDLEVAKGVVDQPIEVPPSGGKTIVAIKVHTDLAEYLEAENPRTILNFAMNLAGTSNKSSHLSLKIKPGVLIGGKNHQYPTYFTISQEFSSGE